MSVVADAVPEGPEAELPPDPVSEPDTIPEDPVGAGRLSPTDRCSDYSPAIIQLAESRGLDPAPVIY